MENKEMLTKGKEDIEKMIKRSLKAEFGKSFEANGSKYITEYYNIEKQKEILEEIIKKLEQKNEYEQEKNIDRYEVKEIFEKFYFKILNDEHKKYELHEEYINKKILEEQEQIEMEEQKKQQRNKTVNTYINCSEREYDRGESFF